MSSPSTQDDSIPTSCATTTTSNTDTPSTSSLLGPLEEKGITAQDLETAVRVLNAVADLQHIRKRPAPSEEETTNDDGTTTRTTTQKDPVLVAYGHGSLRPFRKGLARCLLLHQRRMYEGKTQEEYLTEKLGERKMKRQKQMENQHQRKFIENTKLRRGRIEKLKEKQSENGHEEYAKLQHFMIPDGHVDTTTNNNNNNNNNTNNTTPKLLTASSNISESGDGEDVAVVGQEEETVKLPKLRSCYACKVRYRDLHHFYDQLCPKCATINWDKRHQTANLHGKVAVVTGSRVKIGYQTCLKLLRAGATVVATTRFPNAAAATYRKESDFLEWSHRLQVYGLDLRDVTGLEAFCRYLHITFGRTTGIDILINNACQTIRRPTGYYRPACDTEEQLWKDADDVHKELLSGCMQFEHIRRQLLFSGQTSMITNIQGQPQSTGGGSSSTVSSIPLLTMNEPSNYDDVEEVVVLPAEPSSSVLEKNESNTIVTTVDAEDEEGNNHSSFPAPFARTGISHSTAMTQMVLLPEDVGVSDSILPPGLTDVNNQQLDLRTTNSWLLKMEDVSTPEVMECMFINAIAPFVLNSRLKPLMSEIPKPHEDRYIVNVSAMEGKFYRYKMPNHPHTNMAKAALNMMTRTSADDLAKNHGIYMNSVDTGWINDENPLERANNTAKNNFFQTPIDEIDAAARILDPIFTGMNHPEIPKEYGKFLKDYAETEW